MRIVPKFEFKAVKTYCIKINSPSHRQAKPQCNGGRKEKENIREMSGSNRLLIVLFRLDPIIDRMLSVYPIVDRVLPVSVVCQN